MLLTYDTIVVDLKIPLTEERVFVVSFILCSVLNLNNSAAADS